VHELCLTPYPCKPIYHIKAKILNKKNNYDSVEGYYDQYDLVVLRKKAKEIKIIRTIQANELYLATSHSDKKRSGTYYTPDSLARPLIEKAINHQLDGPFKDRSILELRILDCSCGSGHMLVEALNILTLKALEKIDTDKFLYETLKTEKQKIESNLKEHLLDTDIIIDEFSVLKKILLKKVIFGVDISFFSIELAQLALWIDTYIFGTPLSFIEHHVKSGNSLIGTDLNNIANVTQLANDKTIKRMIELLNYAKIKIENISTIYDTNQNDVAKSKELYKNIKSSIKIFELYFNLVNYYAISKLKTNNRLKLDKILYLISAVELQNTEIFEREIQPFLNDIENYKQIFNFFNWEIEFADVFDRNNPSLSGFHIIIGNPPWEMTQFEEPQFFSEYRSNYRSLSNSEKKAIASDLLDNPEIKKKYDEEKEQIYLFNEYLKIAYPYNKGSGSGNLFRFFVERSLNLLTPGGSLNFIVPTDLMTENSSDLLRQYIFQNYRINYFDGFENRKKLFPGVDSRYKFGLIQIENNQDYNQSAKTRFMLTDPAILNTEDGCFDYPYDIVKELSPKFLAYMDVKGGNNSLDLLRRLYPKYPPLDINWLNFRQELNATKHKKIFKEKYSPSYLPLYKGEMIWQFNANFNDA
jgi:type II restriction/modification system DNA methylase subunit YeeA